MPEWISWTEAVEVVALYFPAERAEGLLREALSHGGDIEVRVSDQGYTTSWPEGCNVPANPDYPHAVGEERPYFRIEDVDLRTLKAWLKELTSAEPARAPAGDLTNVRRGGVEKADWEAYRQVFTEKVASDGYPDEHNVKGWQRQADVARWLSELVQRDHVDVAASTLARHAKALMEQHSEHRKRCSQVTP